MREIVIVISDLYFPEGQSDSPPGAAASGTGALPGIEYVTRFGQRATLEGGWRPWLARWLGRADLADVAPGVIAAAALAAPVAAEATAVELQPDSTSWIATPVHLIAGLTSLHLDRRSILRLPATDLESFARDFNRAFGDSGLLLTPLPGGDFLMQGPAALTAATTEPARALVTGLEASLPKGNGAKALRRLGAELEMWVHANPLNETRRRRGELPVSTLWLWGGAPVRELTPDSSNTHTDLAFGNDPYLAGLWHVHGDRSRALPDRLTNLLAEPHAQRAIFVAEVTPMLHLNPRWSVLEPLAELDRRFVAPAIAALGEGVIESVVLIANDAQWCVRRRDRLKLWRGPRPGISGLLLSGGSQRMPFRHRPPEVP